MRLIPGDECARVYSGLGLDRAYRSAGAGASFGVGRFDPRHLPGCAAMLCTNTAAFPGAVVFPADPVVNGTFSVDASWNKGLLWTIGGGTANAATLVVTSDLSQACLTVGNTYTITYTVTSISSGDITLYAGTTAGTARAAPGPYTETLLCAGNTSLIFRAAANTTASIDNVICAPQNVSQWTDLSGAGHHLEQATAANRPLWVASGTGGVLRFDGATDRIVCATWGGVQPTEVYILAKPPTAPAATSYLLDGTGIATLGIYVGAGAPATLRATAGGADCILATTLNVWKWIRYTSQGANSELSSDNGAPAVANTGVGNHGGLTVGCYAGGGGGHCAEDVAAVLLYSRVLSTAERGRLYRWALRQRGMLAL